MKKENSKETVPHIIKKNGKLGFQESLTHCSRTAPDKYEMFRVAPETGNKTVVIRKVILRKLIQNSS